MYYYPVIIFTMSLLPLMSLLMKWSWLIDFTIVMLGNLTISFSFYLDQDASMFTLTVMWIFLMVMLYSFSYLSSEIYLKRFLAILALFACSMCILILSGNLFNSLIGWDGLGVTSLFLILFYYSNSALKASTLTFLMNRVGDCFFIMTLVSIFLLSENQIFVSSTTYSSQVMFLLVLTSITKSAQIPFSTWLPAAMEAPTPVSALVHSSTLVTAGIFLLYRYNSIWMNGQPQSLLLLLSLSTCFMAAMAALVENDLKKLIALSTLSQLGFIMFSMSLGLIHQSFLHMIMHAFFKALLFMTAGQMIHSFNSSQSITNLSLYKDQSPLLTSIISCSLLSMVGLPFMSGFYSKDLIIDALKASEWSILVLALTILSFLGTVLYSVRMIWYLMASSSNWHSMSDSDLKMIKPMIPLAFLSSMGGSIASWLFIEMEMFVNSSKVTILALLMMTTFLYWNLKMIHSSDFLEMKWNLSVLNPSASNFLFYSSLVYQKSSDLHGIPEILNMSLKKSIIDSSNWVSSTMLKYSGNLEFLLFLVLLLVLI